MSKAWSQSLQAYAYVGTEFLLQDKVQVLCNTGGECPP